ncbi:MAG: hypothetical protein HY423_03340 [Candidatus Lambdaproteobacteria bacterium]|nr:hypothetical protein [Candidatus Lambdaproteobacteria bacterium]
MTIGAQIGGYRARMSVRLGAALWLALALAVPAGAGYGAEPATRPAPPPAAARPEPSRSVGDQDILIFRPLETGAQPAPETLLEVPGGNSCLFDAQRRRLWGCGYMYPFVVEVSAFSAIRWIAVNGRVLARPNSTWARALEWVVASPGGTKVEVEAATASRTARSTFMVRIPGVRLPGTPFFIDLSAP